MVEHLTVGGRTSSYVPELQKKTRAKKEEEDENLKDDLNSDVKPPRAKSKAKKVKVKVEGAPQ